MVSGSAPGEKVSAGRRGSGTLSSSRKGYLTPFFPFLTRDPLLDPQIRGNMHRIMILIPALTLLLAVQSGVAQSQSKARSKGDKAVCDQWRAMVDPDAQSSSKAPDVEQLSEEEAATGIACMLAFEGNRRVGRFSGATRLDISQNFADATVELDALYVISAIYNRQWRHARGVALVDRRPKILSPEAGASKAFPFVKRWHQRLRENGLEKLRAEHDDPLNGSGLRWY